MTTIERMARALFDSYAKLSGVNLAHAEPYWESHKGGYIESARAALQAIRDVPMSILEEASKQAYGPDPLPHEVMNFEGAYVATIDAILEEKPE